MKEKINFDFLFFFSFRNVFYVYASTLGTEEVTSEADDVFNEKVELHVFREKVKTSNENEVRGRKWENPGKMKIDISSSSHPSYF